MKINFFVYQFSKWNLPIGCRLKATRAFTTCGSVEDYSDHVVVGYIKECVKLQ